MPDVALMPKFPPEALGVGVRVHVKREWGAVFLGKGNGMIQEFDAIIEKTSTRGGLVDGSDKRSIYALIVIDEHDNPTDYRAWFTADELTVTDSDRNRGCWIIDKYQTKA